jgi:RNA polymerase sigma-70 factor (ECF subfamily)
MPGHEESVTRASASPAVASVQDSTAADAGVPAGVDAERVAELVKMHYDLVWRLLRRLGAPDVEDAVQRVFWVAARKFASIEVGHERAFLMGVATRVAADARRTTRRRRETGEEPPDGPSSAPSVEELVDRRRARQLLDRLLDRMSPDLRETFVLFEIEELSSPEIAQLLTIPVGTVASRLRRAREVFNHEVARYQRDAAGEERQR